MIGIDKITASTVKRQLKSLSPGPTVPKPAEKATARGTFEKRIGALQEFKASPTETVKDGVSWLSMIGSAIASFLTHIPGFNIPVAAAQAARLEHELGGVEYKKAAIRHQLANIAPNIHPEKPIKLGVDVEQFLRDNPNISTSAVLANTLAYAMAQKERHTGKSEIYLRGTQLNLAGGIATVAGAHIAGVGAIPGIAVSATGSAIQGGVTMRSIFNYVRKKVQGTLGIERQNHAKLLYNLACEHLQNKEGSDDDKRARQAAYDLLRDVGILDPKNLDDFYQYGPTHTAIFLRSRN